MSSVVSFILFREFASLIPETASNHINYSVSGMSEANSRNGIKSYHPYFRTTLNNTVSPHSISSPVAKQKRPGDSSAIGQNENGHDVVSNAHKHHLQRVLVPRPIAVLFFLVAYVVTLNISLESGIYSVNRNLFHKYNLEYRIYSV
jgi:hypothetical protein